MTRERLISMLSALLLRRRLRPWLMAGVGLLVILIIVALSPSPLEENTSSSSALLDPEALANEDQATLATGIPKRIPEYSINQFQYVSTVDSEKQWKILAERAFLYNTEKLTHARQIHAYIYDPDGQATLVTGKEAKFFMNKRDLEIYGDVHTTFPDGFELVSDYLRYLPNERKVIIPAKYRVEGDDHGGKDGKSDQKIQFVSQGLDFEMARSEIVLPESVRMMMIKAPPPPAPGKPKASKNREPERTIIESDHAVIHRDRQMAYFTMNPSRPLEKRFVRISQPTMITRARRAQLNYGDFSTLLQYMTAFEDVVIKELPGKESPKTKDAAAEPEDGDEKPSKPSLRYATGGRADFDARSDIIRLTEFPQCYQDNDTITGDVIIMHRDTDLVEVEHSNAFSQGQQDE